ncbi:MAG TPA: hypothetical protein VMH02_03355 [Verrucomicrobiae bacterium]|nr:hypothetical protein [Verrucomicrobiae bacterium]
MRVALVAGLAAVLGTAAVAGAAGTSVTVGASNTSFKAAMAACPGALAGITFTLNHVRIAELAGVSSDIDDADPTAQLVTLTAANGASAAVTVDAKAHTVAAKHVKLAGKTVACVSAD